MTKNPDEALQGHPFEDRLRADPDLARYVLGLEEKAVQLEADKIQLAEQVIRDPKTGLYNDRFFNERIQIEFRAAGASRNRCVAVIFDDLDHFRLVNNRYGHPIGDELLRRVADIKRKGARELDYPCRTGGEEGAIILPLPGMDPEAGMDVAIRVADRIRGRIANLDLQDEIRRELSSYSHREMTEAELQEYLRLEVLYKDIMTARQHGNPKLAITISQGIGIYPTGARMSPLGEILSPDELSSYADKALYLAKERGRNRFCTIFDQR